MIQDLFTVMWRERRGFLRQGGSRLRMLLSLFVPGVFFAIILPWEQPEVWLTRIASILASAAVPIVLTMLTVPDSFAGERERHTLSTLLASRLPDGAILLGKVIFLAGLSWGVTLVVLLVGLIVANISHPESGLHFYDPGLLAVDLSLALILSLLGTGAGILISLKAETVQQAQQLLAAILLLPPTLLGPIVLIVSQSKPEWSPKVLFAGADPLMIYMIIFGVLAAITGVLFALVKRRFRRARLILIA